jgi:hypothetical protein
VLETRIDAQGNQRDRFRIEDFEHKGRIALSTHAQNGSRLIARPTYTGPASVVWDAKLDKVTVSVPGNGAIAPIEAKGTSEPKVPDGTYRIRPKLPLERDDPSQPFLCERYQDRAQHACHWWLIEWKPEKGYSFHTGARSLGCVTVVEHAKWEAIYDLLAKARTTDGRFAGDIVIRGH